MNQQCHVAKENKRPLGVCSAELLLDTLHAVKPSPCYITAFALCNGAKKFFPVFLTFLLFKTDSVLLTYLPVLGKLLDNSCFPQGTTVSYL